MADKDTIYTTPTLDTPGSDTPNASAQDSGSTDSNSQYSLRNHKLAPYSTTTMKNQKKKKKKIDYKDTTNTNPAPDAPGADTPNDSSHTMAPQTPISHIHREIAINIEKPPPTPKYI